MPVALLRTYAQGMDRTRAGELLGLYSVIAAGSGSLRKGDAQQVLRDLQRQATGPRRARVPTPDELRAAGIAYIEGHA